MLAGEATAASARWLSSRVLETNAFVVAVSGANVCAFGTGTVISRFAFALEVTCLRNQKTISVGIAVHFFAAHVTRIRAFSLARLQKSNL